MLAGAVLKGHTVEELVLKLGADPQVLQATIDRGRRLLGDSYPMGVMGRIARSYALVFGRLVGIHAAELAYD